ncbi:MAG TPA: ATP-binding protein [Candidatus Acidoferrales bacterium]|jgi:hypothetical protein|nr:ATP-binding protein [Candidatus Acidoferrales bacterium]
MSGTANTATADTPQVLLEHHLKMLRLPTFLREYDKVARQCSDESVDYPRYLLRMTELELLDRERRATKRRIHQARFPVVKSLDTFEFFALLWYLMAIAALLFQRKVIIPDSIRVRAESRYFLFRVSTKGGTTSTGRVGSYSTHIARRVGNLQVIEIVLRLRLALKASTLH